MVLCFVVVGLEGTSKWDRVNPLVGPSSLPDSSCDVELVNRVRLKSVKPLIGFGLEEVWIRSG